jgi:hypothetical protein
MRESTKFSWHIVRARTVLISILSILLLQIWTVCQEKDKPKAAVGPEFAKAATAAFVAIRNSTRSARDVTDLSPDQTVQAAINNADAVASSDSEASVVQKIKFLAILLPVEQGTYDLAPSKAALAKLDQTYSCINAWRKALRDLSGDEPKECSSDDKK